MGHLTKWLFFSLMFGAIPYALVAALNQLQSPGSPLLHPSSEILFIAVVATSSALGELWDQDGRGYTPREPGRIGWQLMMLVGVLISSLLYGAYVYATLMGPGRAHGVDCSAVVSWMPTPGRSDPWKAEMVRQWGGVCVPWVRSQALFFCVSLGLTLICAAVSTAAIYRFPPRRW